ncbi:NUDIX hydrolase [Streptomyces sp. Go40/10]|uniref:NUDIX hydrolase n=1 Tax=Streptomyces sp. Go40/10 TaxID=2825844 RepID=UPI001E51CED7|nr:NUDIX hydrolase [Streptomyces sp. Go40/10]UFR07072.1 NUDIX hydrolase [Streptomyces sp. Go40/10]
MTSAEPFTRIKIRVAAALFNGELVALIHRTKNGQDQYTLPGGNVEPGEPLHHALARELNEELGLDLTKAIDAPRLTWIQDAMVTRPGPTPPRKLHLVFRVHIDNSTRADLRTVEHDDTAGTGHLTWNHYKDTAGKALFPPVPLAELATPTAPLDAARALLPSLDDTNYRWV